MGNPFPVSARARSFTLRGGDARVLLSALMLVRLPPLTVQARGSGKLACSA